MSGLEVIGTIAAISEIVNRAQQCYDVIKRLKNAHKEFSFVLREVSFSRVVLKLAARQLEDLNIGPSTDATVAAWAHAVKDLSARADIKLKEIADLVARVSETRGRILIVKRVSWIVEANALKELRLGLAAVREEFVIALDIAQGEHQKYAIDRLEYLGDLAEKIYHRQGQDQLKLDAYQAILSNLYQVFEDALEVSGSHSRRQQKSILDMATMNPELDLAPLMLTETNDSSDTQSHRGSITEEFSALSARRRSSDSSGKSISPPPVRQRVGYARSPGSCDPSCRCRCHRINRLSTPRGLTQLVGNASVTVTGWRIARPSCNMLSTCKRAPDWQLHSTYVFPTWLLYQAVSAHMRSGPMGDPALQLQLRNIVYTDAFRLAQVGDWQGMDDFYGQGKGSVHDMHPQEGQSALLVAIWCGQPEVVRYLLGKNASMEEETFEGMATTDAALRHVYGRVSTPSTVALFAHLFNIEELRDEQQFNVIHKVVIGLASSRDLEDECREHRELVDEADIRGRTPLWWAALRHELKDCRILLDYGAKPNTADYQGETIMQNAAASVDPELIELLIDAGGELGSGAVVKETPLHYAARSNSRRKMVEVLLQRGADPNAANINGITPLHECIEVDGIDVAILLCDAGTDLSHRDATHDTYIQMAIRCRASRILNLLLSKGADLTALGQYDQTVLHKAAKYGDEKIISELLNTSLAGIDPARLDSTGKDATSYIKLRMADAHRSKTLEESILEERLMELVKHAASCNAAAGTSSTATTAQKSLWESLPELLDC